MINKQLRIILINEPFFENIYFDNYLCDKPLKCNRRMMIYNQQNAVSHYKLFIIHAFDVTLKGRFLHLFTDTVQFSSSILRDVNTNT